MKKILLTLSLMIAITIVKAQTYVSADFTSAAFPPSGWTIDAHSGNWSRVGSHKAGGKDAGEARLHYDPTFNGYTRFISPVVDLTGVTNLSLEFNHMLDFYGGSTEYIGVATRSGGGDWNTVWEVAGANIAAEQKILTITTPDVGASDFQFCFYFRGNSYNINDWYIDDIRLFTPFDHDISTALVLGEDTYFNPNDMYTPQASIYNHGLNTETFQVACSATTYDGTVVYTDTVMVTGLSKGEYQTVNFAPFELASANDVYTIEITTLLNGDMDTDNDTKSKFIYTYIHDRDMVLVEIGTGTGCPYCPGAAMGADDLVEAGKPVAVLEYHSYNTDDPFNNDAAAARKSYYGITGFPTAVFDGLAHYVGGSNNKSLFPAYEPLVDARTPVRVGVGLMFTTTPTARGYHVVVTVMKFGPVMGTNFVLHFAVTESEIAYNWQGQTKLDFVERLMLPDANGTPIDIANNNTIVKEYDFDVDDSWNIDELEVVAFIQDLGSKEIMNGHKEMLKYVGIIENNASDIALSTYPNPFTESANISFNLKNGAQTTLEIYSLQGKHIATLVNKTLPEGKHQFNWAPEGSIANGMYVMKLNIGGKVFTQKLAIQR